MFAGYSHPYVISFSDRAIDVFDSSTAEWLQTIPLKKVRFKYWSRNVFFCTFTLTFWLILGFFVSVANRFLLIAMRNKRTGNAVTVLKDWRRRQ